MRIITALCALTPGFLSGLEIEIRYDFDTNNFFDTAEKRAAMEAVADFYGSMIQDNLLEIDVTPFQLEDTGNTWTAFINNPSTGSQVSLFELVVPEDTIIVYVGSRDLSGNLRGIASPGGFEFYGFPNWNSRVRARGQAGADVDSAPTEVAPWGGVIAFDDATNWNFSLTENLPGVEFVTVALHEMGHVLGIGTTSVWDSLVVDGNFTGSATTQSNGSSPSADFSHFTNSLSSPFFGSFGVSHGGDGPVLMLPVFFDDNNTVGVVTDLDLAALVDLGWELSLPPSLGVISLSPSSSSFTWPSNSFFSYEIARMSSLGTQSGGSPIFDGDGSMQSWSDPSPLSERAFYQLRTTTSVPNSVTAPAPSVQAAKSVGTIRSYTIPPRVVTGCCSAHQ